MAGVVLVLLLAAATTLGAVDAAVDEIRLTLQIVQLVKEVGTEVARVLEVYEKTDEQERLLMLSVEKLSHQVDAASGRSEEAVTSLLSAQQTLPTLLRYELRLDALVETANQVETMFLSMAQYTKGGVERHTLEDFAHSVVSHGQGSVRRMLSSMHQALLGKASAGRSLDTGVLKMLQRAVEDSGSKVCALEQSPQQLIYNLYNLVALAELKGYAMMQFSWMILKQYEKGNFTTEAELMRAKTEKRSEEKAKAAREAMKAANRMVWRCDPKQHEENNTYIQLTELLQGYVQNEVDLNSKSSCGENCGYYTYAKVHGCYHNQYCSKQRNCAGRVFNCQFIDSDSWVCPSDSPNRRYDFIEYENGRVLGRPGHCSKGTTKVDSWWRWLFWHCSYCFCFCDDDGPHSDRYFSLRPAMADTANGFAITGLKFVKSKRVVHLQVQQGKVLPRGGVNAATVEWRPVEAFEVATAAPGRDYHKMDYEQRAIDLDDVTAPPGYVLTGVRFRRIGSHLNTEILATPMDMETGALKPDASLWFGNDNTDAAESDPRTSVALTNPDIPTRSSLLSEPDSVTDQFVTFTHSDISKDAGQTTVPFLDAQAVAPNPPILLAGAGVYHKGRRGYGGFVGLRVITYDFSDYLGANETDTTNLNLVN